MIIIIIICYCLQSIAQISQINQLFQLLNIYFLCIQQHFLWVSSYANGKTMTSAKIRLFLGDWKFLVPTKNVKAWLHLTKLVASHCRRKCSATQSSNNHCLIVTIFRIKCANTDRENADRRTIIFKVFIRHFCFFRVIKSLLNSQVNWINPVVNINIRIETGQS